MIWTAGAIENLEAIIAYIASFNEAAAHGMAEKLYRLGESLAEFPSRGPDAGEGKREMTIVPPYVLRYMVAGDRVLILRIRHGARELD